MQWEEKEVDRSAPLFDSSTATGTAESAEGERDAMAPPKLGLGAWSFGKTAAGQTLPPGRTPNPGDNDLELRGAREQDGEQMSETPTHATRAVRTPRSERFDPEEVARNLEPKLIAIRDPLALAVKSLNLWYGAFQALHGIDLDIASHRVTAFIGPSGCGKSTLLRTFNRMNDLVDHVRVQGEVLLDGKNVLGADVDVNVLRRRVGMVFQKSNPFPKSIYENVAYGQRIGGMRDRDQLLQVVTDALMRVGLWDEVKNRLDKSALDLSGGQQQRLCIARAIAVQPDIVLMDEPCSALDPIATAKIEELIEELKRDYTIVIVTHNMQQAARVSDYTAFMWLGRVVEYDRTEQLFTNPSARLTEDYITGRFG